MAPKDPTQSKGKESVSSGNDKQGSYRSPEEQSGSGVDDEKVIIQVI
jgi:hypothetical protein